MLRNIPHHRYVLTLLALFLALAIPLGIAPWHRADWLLENALVVAALAVLAVLHWRCPLSRISYTLVFLFLCLHEVGAHYTYAEVPYDAWWRSLTGRSFNEHFGWQRNHFDRLVPFLYGFLLAYPLRELFLRIADVRGFWGYFLPLDFTMSTSLLYELVEWAAAEFFGGELGQAYLGTQGDVWDAHKDMALASLGALLAMMITALIVRRHQRDFAREWAESLRVKNRAPLGEEALAKLRQDKSVGRRQP